MAKTKYDRSDTLNGTLFEPPSDWMPPKFFPTLTCAKVIGIDIETKDPNLHTRGPGFLRRDAEVVGVSVAHENTAWYFPFGHLGGGNMQKHHVVAFLRDLLVPGRFLVGANLQYELEGIDAGLGIEAITKCNCLDIQIAEALLEEEREESYALESLAQMYLGKGKDEALLRMAAEAYGVHPHAGLWKLHSKYVGAYGEWDALAALQIFKKQLPKLEAENLKGIFELEGKLLPLLWLMRKQGIPVDLDKARALSDDLAVQEQAVRNKLKEMVGFHVDEWSGKQIEKVCDKYKLGYPRTPKGNPSFTGEYLEGADHPALQLISEIREFNRLRETFVNDWVFKHQIDGWIHPQWKQLASDDGGTRTGRMAAANPNPQQVPSRSELAKVVRAMFRAPPPLKWAKLDYSQQEPRILVHFASLCNFTGAGLIKLAYEKNRKMDIYQFLADTTGMSRRDSKDATLGRCYGMGARRFAAKQGITKEMAQQKLDEFDRQVPFVKEISDSCALNAQRRGYIKTLLGRRRHFNYWEPADAFQRRDRGEDVRPLPEKVAKMKWPNMRLVRAFTHKALNSLIQGSAADMTKAAMLSIHEQTGRIPYMQVHDELDFGVESQEVAEQLQSLAESCVEMSVPIRADLHFGDHWK